MNTPVSSACQILELFLLWNFFPGSLEETQKSLLLGLFPKSGPGHKVVEGGRSPPDTQFLRSEIRACCRPSCVLGQMLGTPDSKGLTDAPVIAEW